MLDPHPILLPGQFRLWEWIASYYLCTPGDVYKAALPSGMKLESETIVTLNTDYEADSPPLRPRTAGARPADGRPRTVHHPAGETRRTGANLLPVVNSLLAKGAIHIKEELKRSYKPKTEARVKLGKGFDTEERIRPLFDELARAPSSSPC